VPSQPALTRQEAKNHKNALKPFHSHLNRPFYGQKWGKTTIFSRYFKKKPKNVCLF
jgi:hypothetical protein